MAYNPYDFGASFPGTPVDGYLFYRTDLKTLYEYDGTSANWLSADRKYISLSQANALSAAGNVGFAPIIETLYVESFVATTFLSTNNATNKWTLTLSKATPGNVLTTIATVDTGSDTASNWTKHVVPIASVIDTNSFVTFQLVAAKTGTPSNLSGGFDVIVRTVAT